MSKSNLRLAPRVIASVISGATAAALPTIATAQDTPAATPAVALQEVIVTATKTGATAAQKTPMALTVLTGEQLEASGVINVTDLAQKVPSLSIPMVTIIPQIYIRGIGSSNVNNGSDPDVTTQLDGVYI